MNKIVKDMIIGGSISAIASTIILSTNALRKNFAKINADTKAEIAAIHYAQGYVEAKLARGDYRGVPLATVMNDLNFYQIAYLNKEK